MEDRIKVLVDTYIHPILLNASISNIMVNVALKINNMGVNNTNDANINNVSLKDIQWAKQQYDYNTNFYNNRCLEYLRHNKELYPEWPGCNCDGMKGGNKNYKIGIVL